MVDTTAFKVEHTVMFYDEWPVRDRQSTDGYVYVIEFSTGVVKVGRTRNPRGRVRQHIATVGAYGVTLTRGWLSIRHRTYENSERQLMLAAASLGQPLSDETFRAPFHDVVAAAAKIKVRQYVPAPRGMGVARMSAEERQAEVYEMRTLGSSMRKIAEVLGVSLGTVQVDCQQIVKRLTQSGRDPYEVADELRIGPRMAVEVHADLSRSSAG